MKAEKIVGANNKQLNDFIHSVGISQPVPIPCWVEYFLKLAETVATRSKDAQTAVGAVLSDNNNHVIATGYNSFPRGMPDNLLPNTRPEKYKWMQHAELSCILNCTVSPWSSPGCTLYVTAMPCFPCLKATWGFNIQRVYYSDWSAKNAPSNSTTRVIDEDSLMFIKLTGMEVYHVQ